MAGAREKLGESNVVPAPSSIRKIKDLRALRSSGAINVVEEAPPLSLTIGQTGLPHWCEAEVRWVLRDLGDKSPENKQSRNEGARTACVDFHLT